MFKGFHTIRTKLFLSFTLTILALQLLLWLASAYGMQSLIIFSRERNMTKIVEMYHEKLETDSIDVMFPELAMAAEGNLTYWNAQSGAFYTTIPQMRGDRMMQPRSRSSMEAIRKASELSNGEVKAIISDDHIGMPGQLTVIGKLSDHEYLISERQLIFIRESSQIFTKYMGVAGVLTVIFGALISVSMARRVTKPIIVIEEQAQKIAQFDFSTPNQIRTQDEIGSLAESVNQIAVALEERIVKLSEANLQLKGEIEQERQLEQARRLFVSNVSHELKTPISMIMGYADGLKHGIARTPEQQKHYYEVIIKESEHMSELITQLLDLSAYQSGKLPCNKVEVRPEQMISQNFERYQSKFEEALLTIKLDLAGTGTVMADPKRLEMVLNNLMTNCIKYADSSTEVTMKSYYENQLWHFEMSNQVQDFNPEEIPQLAVSFFRGENAREKQADGFGIGLSAVEEIIRQHEGHLKINYEANRFIVNISLPV